MGKPFSGSIPAAGVANAVVNNLAVQDAQLLLEISGAYKGAQLVFEALPIGGTVWMPVGGVQQDTLSVITGSQNAPYVVSPDGVTLGFKFDVTGCSALRVWASSLTQGPIAVQETSGSFFAAAPSGAALSYGVQLATLWQLQHLTFLLANSDEKLAALFTQNPILPAGLPPSVWDVTG